MILQILILIFGLLGLVLLPAVARDRRSSPLTRDGRAAANSAARERGAAGGDLPGESHPADGVGGGHG